MRLPDALRPLMQRDRWVAWRCHRDCKLPHQPRKAGCLASTKDETTWGTYEEAWRTAQRIDGGVGFVIGDRIAALDLDDCRNSSTGSLAPWARALIEQADSYTEVTPSGHGLRIIGFACGRSAHRVRKQSPGKVEIYRDCARYITVTGDQLGHADLANIDHVINELLATLPHVNGGSDVIVVEDVRDDWRNIVKRYAFELRGCVQTPVAQGKRSDIIFKIGIRLREKGASPGEVAQVLRHARCWRDKHGDDEEALAREVQRLFARS